MSAACQLGGGEAEAAKLVWEPAMANAGDRTSEGALRTLELSVASGVELTKPTSFTTRTRRERSPPQAFFTCASSEMAQDFAA